MVPLNLHDNMIQAYQDTMGYEFKKQVYMSNIKMFQEDKQALLASISSAIAESDDAMKEVAGYVPDYIHDELQKISSKRKRNLKQLDFKLDMVSYFVPLMGRIPGGSGEAFSGKIVDHWNELFPDDPLEVTTVETINSGFRNGLCYITTAVCRSLDKPDDCYELTTLRNFRDQYLMRTPNGEALIEEYYNVAPTIVKHIDRCDQADEIYRQIWEGYLSSCIRFIEEGKMEECAGLYQRMVKELEKSYF